MKVGYIKKFGQLRCESGQKELYCFRKEGISMQQKELNFDFVNKPLKDRMVDGVASLMQKGKSREKLSSDFDKVIYFKTEVQKTCLGDFRYIVFYTDSGVICPTLSEKQLKRVVEAQKGYIGFKQEVNRVRGVVNLYTVKQLERAHSYPYNIDLDVLVGNNAVLPLQ